MKKRSRFYKAPWRFLKSHLVYFKAVCQKQLMIASNKHRKRRPYQITYVPRPRRRVAIFKTLQAAADLGHPKAKVKVAGAYTVGWGVLKDRNRGIAMIKKLARDGNHHAMLWIAEQYLGYSTEFGPEPRLWESRLYLTRVCFEAAAQLGSRDALKVIQANNDPGICDLDEALNGLEKNVKKHAHYAAVFASEKNLTSTGKGTS